ncbi:MAG: hypothetical protein IPL81_14555 [Flavobacteriales bacterium]|nr:hypothetical protein [Flavobacteriales bacterium]
MQPALRRQHQPPPPKGSKEFGTRTEVKNMNSFKNVQRKTTRSGSPEVLDAGGNDQHGDAQFLRRTKAH